MLTRVDHGREIVTHCCWRAHQAGVQHGMTLSHARALVKDGAVHVEAADPQRDAAALKALADWATRYLPLVEADHGDDHPPCHRVMPGLLADISGCDRLYRGEQNLLDQLHHAITRLGFDARIAAAPTFGCAWAVARFAGERLSIVEPDQLRSSLENLSTRGMRLGAKTEQALEEVGIQTIGQLLALPRRSLAARFGQTIGMRIDQALGQAIETINPVRPRAAPRVIREFAGPVKQVEAIEQCSYELLEALCELLLHRECGVRHLVVVLQRSDCPPLAIDLVVSRPTRSVKHLWRLLRPKLERAHLGFGVDAITMTARRFSPLPHQQIDHADLGRTERDADLDQPFAEMIDVLSGRLGVDRICRIQPRESYIPERVLRLAPIGQSVGLSDAEMLADDRPSILFRQPCPVRMTALSPAGPLVQLVWRGECRRVLHTIGPQRVCGEWWRPDAWARDYFKVQDEHGCWWWLYRQEPTDQWFVHGQWA